MSPGRREERQLCADLVKIQWNPAQGSSRCEWAILEDISASGACFGMDEPIPPDTVVSLQFDTEHCQARIIYCRFDHVKYLLGVEFEQGYKWSRRRFKPEHLIQFRMLKVHKNR
jgi:hypothetical protein